MKHRSFRQAVLGFSLVGSVSFLGFAGFTLAAPVPVDRLEASVNSALILTTDISKFRETLPLRAQLDPLFAGTSVAANGPKAADTEIVQFLVNEKIIQQQFPITDAEVEQEINSILANNRIDRSTLRNTLKDQGFSFEDYFEMIRSSAGKRNLIDREIRTKVTVSEDDVKNYYYNHFSGSKAESHAYHVRLITLSVSNYKSAAAAKETADRALREIQGGEAFEEVAKRVSDDPNASAGGDLGTLTDDQLSPAIREQLKKLQAGQVSGVFGNASAAFFIIKLVEVTSGANSKFEKMKEEIRNQLAASEYQHQISLWLERQRQTAFIHLAGERTYTLIPGAGK